MNYSRGWSNSLNLFWIDTDYRVRLAKSGACCEWLTTDDDLINEMILTVEPDSSFSLRLKTWLLSPFVPEQLL